MSAKSTTAILALALILVLAATSLAFDGNRKGFILGAGLGLGYTSHKNSLEHETQGVTSFERLTSTGLATDFRIGYGFSEGFLLYYTSKVNWLKAGWVVQREDTIPPYEKYWAESEDTTTAAGVGGIGLSYYLDPESSPLYLIVAVPLAGWVAPFEDNMNTLGGLGFSAGAGYEFAKHLSVEAVVFYGRVSDDQEPLKFKNNFFGAMVTVNGLLY